MNIPLLLGLAALVERNNEHSSLLGLAAYRGIRTFLSNGPSGPIEE